MVAGVDSGFNRVLVVDDEASIRELVSTVLRYEGYAVETCATGSEALRAVTDTDPHLVVLDVMLPDFDGFEVQRRLRRAGKTTPVIFLTARGDTEDRVHGLTIGGDDYVSKPFSLDELVARVRAVLRRRFGEQETGRLVFHDLELDDERHEVRRGGAVIDLTPTEFKLLRMLLRNPGRVLTRAQILDHVWAYDFGGESNVVETYISTLRRKIDSGRPAMIQTVRGIGYSLRDPRPE